MDVGLWIAGGLLALVALAGGISKTFVPKEKLAAHRGGEWTRNAAAGFVRTLGVLELLAAAGLILPALTGIAPVLVPITAACWVGLMVGAMITHLRYDGGWKFAIGNLVWLAVAVFVLWGRLGPQPFTT
ncbi:DoxX family protein [Actinoplanes palleronii]|uniref:DoxX-like protein n=1 Tax=Actinoplanes palleronii TaxID=113570 RepID=A0ABQ4BR68_9ACTN|nr:DoxX family protein [Actinoplanes palleronii]GIE73161.1 hypothetical protein Apa02nite_092690 [Actinoplanes palleronii]